MGVSESYSDQMTLHHPPHHKLLYHNMAQLPTVMVVMVLVVTALAAVVLVVLTLATLEDKSAAVNR